MIRPAKEGPRTSIVIPCYNEAEGIPYLCDRLRTVLPRLSSEGSAEVLFIDDGSTDGTSDVIREHAAGLPYRIERHEGNRGLGAALRTGFAASTGEEIVTLDSDCTYDPDCVADLLNLLRSGYDMITGSPYHPQGEVVDAKAWRLFLSKSLSRLYWIVLPGRLYTYTSCFRAYRREMLSQLPATSDGFLAVTEQLVFALLQHKRVGEFPTSLRRRLHGRSKMRIVSVSLSHLMFLARICRRRIAAATGTPTSG